MIHALRYTEELEKVGFSTEQAKASVQIWMELMDQNFATKADFKEYYFNTRNDNFENFKSVDERFKSIDERFKLVDHRFIAIEKRLDVIESKFDTLEYKLIIKLGIMMAASISIVSVIVSLK